MHKQQKLLAESNKKSLSAPNFFFLMQWGPV